MNWDVSVEFPKRKQFTDQYLEQKFLKENISVEEVTFFFLINLEGKN